MSHEPPTVSDPEMNGPEMNEIEAALAAWTPRAPQIDRDRLMFTAGQSSCSLATLAGQSRLRHLWPVATSLSTAAALFMAFLLTQDRAGTVPSPGGSASTIVSIPDVPPQANRIPTRWEQPAVSDGTYLALRNQMLTTPADEWPTQRYMNDEVRRNPTAVEDDAVREPPTSRNLLREFLPPASKPVRRNPVESPAAQTDQPQEAIS